MSAKIISIANQKGGVGKTTTAINLATALSAIYKKVLIIDLDPQGNASTGFGVANKDRELTSYDILIDSLDAEKAILKTAIPNLHIIASTVDLSAAEIELINVKSREFILKKAITHIKEDYDYIIIDCPPSLGVLTLNALVASHSIIVPMQCEFFALEGLSHLLKTTGLIRKKLNPSLKIEGIVLTMYDKRNKLTEQVEADVRKCFGDIVFETRIPRNVKISEAPSHGKPAIVYDLSCSGSIAYIHLAKELIQKEKKLQNA